MNSILGSVVPLAMFLTYTWAKVCPLRYFISILSGYIECLISQLSWYFVSKAIVVLVMDSLKKYCQSVTKHDFQVYGNFLFVGCPQHPTLKVLFCIIAKLKSLLCVELRDCLERVPTIRKKASTIIFLVACKDIWNASKCQSGAAAPFEICKKRSLSVEH